LKKIPNRNEIIIKEGKKKKRQLSGKPHQQTRPRAKEKD
jgi:hypothetical protein